MPGFKIALFGGVAPRLAPRLLKDSQAQVATNAYLKDGDLRAWTGSTLIATPTKTSPISIYRFGQDITDESEYWFNWTDDTDVARGAIAGDTSERTYFTNAAGAPQVTDNSIALGADYPDASYILGIPKPAAAPSVALTGTGSGATEYRAYVYTYVSGWGEEGPPSDASSPIGWQSGNAVTVSGMSTGPSGSYNITSKNIYRVVTTDNGAQYEYVDSVTLATTSYSDSIADTALGSTLPSTGWIAPPTDMLGIIAMANGMAAGFSVSENAICFAEPYRWHAWPSAYRLAVNYKPVALGSFGTTLVCATKGFAYLAQGVDPSSMVQDRIEDATLAIVSKRSMASVRGFGAVWATPSGLVAVSPAGPLTLLDQLFTRKQWELLVPSSITAGSYDGRYFGFYDDGTVQQGFILDPNDPLGTFTYTDQYATACFTDPLRDAMYLVQSGKINRWDNGGSNLSYTWKSKVFVPTRPINPTCAQVEAASFPVTFKLYADGTLVKTQTVTSNDPFRLPTGYKGREFEVEITGTSEVKAVYVAESIEALKAV